MFISVSLYNRNLQNKNFENGILKYHPFNSELFFNKLLVSLGEEKLQMVLDGGLDSANGCVGSGAKYIIQDIINIILIDIDLFFGYDTECAMLANHTANILNSYSASDISKITMDVTINSRAGNSIGGADSVASQHTMNEIGEEANLSESQIEGINITDEELALEMLSIQLADDMGDPTTKEYIVEMMAKRKMVMRKGIVKMKFMCPSGWKYSKQLRDCAKMPEKERYMLAKRAKRAARSRKLHDNDAAKAMRARNRKINSKKKTSLVGSFLN